ncbi:unnamed protein product [Ectocarpus sp. 12 AP-2014]
MSRILDAGCGPGADIAGLLAHAPRGHVTAVDTHAPFVERVKAKWSVDARVTAQVADMRDASGPFDFIWSAGALYFLGLDDGLPLLVEKLAPQGAIAFSDMVYLSSKRDPEMRQAIEKEAPWIMGHIEHQKRLASLGFTCLGQRVLPPSSWEAYYIPMEHRIAKLSPTQDEALQAALTEAADEIALWRKYYRQFGYVLSVVRPS